MYICIYIYIYIYIYTCMYIYIYIYIYTCIGWSKSQFDKLQFIMSLETNEDYMFRLECRPCSCARQCIL